MNLLLIKYQRAVDQLPLAAKSIILATILGLTFIIWYYGFWQNIQDSITSASAKIKTLDQSIPKLEAQLKTIKTDIKNKLGSVLEDSASSSKILSPHQTISVLRDLLKNTGNLTLLQLENLSPQAALMPQTNLRVFEHGIIIKFQGDYFSTMYYLKAIEKLKWKIFWDKLEYKVVQYPAAEITLYFHTISNEEDWIHV